MEFRIFGFLGLLYGSFYRDPFLRLSSTAPWRVSSLLRALSISSPYPLASQKPFQPSLAVGGGLSGTSPARTSSMQSAGTARPSLKQLKAMPWYYDARGGLFVSRILRHVRIY